MLAFMLIGVGSAFTPPMPSRAFFKGASTLSTKPLSPFGRDNAAPVVIQRQRRSFASVQLSGLFGLGFPELAIILVATVFLLGPQKISEFAKDSGKLASQIPEELKQMPEEFKKGVEEGESNFRARNAKSMKKVPPEIKGADDANVNESTE